MQKLFWNQRLSQPAQHSTLFFRGVVNRTKRLLTKKSLPPTDKCLGYDLKGRSRGDLQEPGEIGFRDS